MAEQTILTFWKCVVCDGVSIVKGNYSTSLTQWGCSICHQNKGFIIVHSITV